MVCVWDILLAKFHYKFLPLTIVFIFRTKDLKVEAKNFRIFFIHTVRILIKLLIVH